MRKNILILGQHDSTQFIDIYNQYVALFDRTQYEVTVAYLTTVSNKNEETIKRTLAEHTLFLNIKKNNLRQLKFHAIKKVITLCRHKKFSLVICHRYKPTYVMLWAAQFCRIPACIFVMHAIGAMSSIRRQLIIAMLYRKNMLFAGVSNSVRDDLRKHLGWCIGKNNIITLYNNVQLDCHAPLFLPKENARQALGTTNNAFIFGHVGRLVPAKNQLLLIRSFATIQPVCPDAKLMILGDGRCRLQLEQEIHTLNISKHVILTGFIAHGSRYMPAFDCFVLPSKTEAFGMVLLEAMLAKIPIIASCIDGIPEVIAQAGTLIKPNDMHALATSMQQMYHWTEHKRYQQGLIGYERATKYFSHQNFYINFWRLPLMQLLKVR